MGPAVKEIVDSGADTTKMKSIIGEKENGLYTLYVDTVDDDHLYGFIKKAEGEGGELDDELTEQLMKDGNYKIELLSRSGASISGTLSILKPDVVMNGVTSGGISKELQKIIDEKVKAGIRTADEIGECIEQMRLNHVDDLLITRVIKGYRTYKKAVKKPNCMYVDPFLQSSLKKHEETLVSEILRSAVSRNGIIFEGEKSVGKNVCAEYIAWLMGMPVRLFTCSRQMTTSTLYGEKTTDNSALEVLKDFDPEMLRIAEQAMVQRTTLIQLYYRLKTNKTLPKEMSLTRFLEESMPEEFTLALKKKAEYDKAKAEAASTNIVIEDSELIDWLTDGGILVLNEMNLCEPNLLASFLNPILDGTGFLTVQGRGEIPINKDCVLIGTQNVDYAGCEEQNEATMSRLACERFMQPDSIEDLLVTSVAAKLREDGFEGTKIDRTHIKQANKFYKACRDVVEKGHISNAVLNIRGFVRALSAVYESGGYSRLKKQLELNVVNTCPLMEADMLRGVLTNHITL